MTNPIVPALIGLAFAHIAYSVYLTHKLYAGEVKSVNRMYFRILLQLAGAAGELILALVFIVQGEAQ